MDVRTTRGIHVTPGSGVVAQLGTFVAYAVGDDAGVNQLIVRLNALADAPWDEVVRTLTSDIAQAGFDDHPELACASIGDEAVGVLVFGDLRLVVTTDGETRVFDGRDSSTWIDLRVHGAAERILCGEQSESNVVGVLRDGVVPGGGFLFDRCGPIPAATRWRQDLASTEGEAAPESAAIESNAPSRPSTGSAPSTVEEPGADDDAEATEPTPAEAPLAPSIDAAPDPATVTGVLCPEGHLTDPDRAVCIRCGSAVAPDAETASGPRPALGILTFDDGATLELDRPVVVGADVPAGYEIDGNPAIVVELDDQDGSISPVHIELHVSDWHVEIVDVQSSGGTYLRSGEKSRIGLRSSQPARLTPGSEVELGSRSFVYTVGPPPADPTDVTGTEFAWLQSRR